MAKIEILNSIFDRDNDNVLKFNNKEERDNYFDNISDKFEFDNINFNAGDLINTQIELNVNGVVSLFKLLNYNYCVVTQNEDRLFYFIERSEQLDGSLITLYLTCDVFQTYFYDIENLQGLITRTHLDRFVKSGDLWKYNNSVDSPLFEREGLEFAKRTLQKQALYQKCMSEDLEKWLKNNIEYWNYYFLAPGTYKCYNSNRTEHNEELINIIYDFGESGELVCIAVPHYKRGARYINIWYEDGDYSTYSQWDDTGLEMFLKQNNGYANIKAIKSSVISPFSSNTDMFGDYTIDSIGSLRIKTEERTVNGFSIITDTEYQYNQTVEFVTPVSDAGTLSLPVGLIGFQKVENFVLKCDGDFFENKFSAENIGNDNEPKLLNEEASRYNIFVGGKAYELPVLKTDKSPVFRYYEPLTPDITKAILTYSEHLTTGATDKVYTEINESDYTGFAIQIDLSKWYTSNNLDTFLANNKNNLQIFDNSQTKQGANALINLTQGLVNTAVNGATGNIAGAVSSGLSTIGNAVNSVIQIEYDRANYDLTLDNMAQSPEQLSVVNSNIALVNAVSGLSIFIELQQPLPFEQQILIDKLKLMGYTFGRLGSLSDYINTRKYYNYIESIVYEISGNFAESVKDKLKSIFNKGVRMWHSDNWTGLIDYNLNNIERSILNG